MAFYRHFCSFILYFSLVKGIDFVPNTPSQTKRFCENLKDAELMFTVNLTKASNPPLTIETEQFKTYANMTTSNNIDYEILAKAPFDREVQVLTHTKQTFFLSILDENDNEPMFDVPTYAADVYEYPWTEDPILSVSATDADNNGAGTVDNIAIQNPGSSDFEVAFTGGSVATGTVHVKSNSQLNFEQLPLIYETVVATDGGYTDCSSGTVLSSTASLIINVQDGPDEPPYFTSARYALELEETETLGPIGIQVEALDGDTGLLWDMEYRIMTDDVKDVFEIDKTTGIISTIGVVDRESPTSLANNGLIVFQVMAIEVDPLDHTFSKDVVNFPLNTTIDVTITVIDVDDEKPTFFYLNSASDTSSKVNQSYFEAEIDEGSSINIAVPNLNIYVQDSDSIINARFSLSLTAGDHAFSVSPTDVLGEASVNLIVKDSTRLDHNLNPFILVEITAQSLDGLKSTQATVNITVRDINDHPPVFESSSYTAQIPENSKNGTEILTIQATDDDSGINAELTYSLQNTNVFSINNATGQVTVIGDLDREVESTYYVVATVNDNPGRSDVVTITINVTDTNDNPPIFQRTSYVANLAENSTKFTTTVLLDAIDNDEAGTVNSEVSYTILSGDTYNNFAIKQPPKGTSAGQLVVNSPVDLESLDSSQVVCSGRGTGTINLEVMVYDHGEPSLNSTVNVTVSVEDINDQEPVFPQDIYEAEIPEKSNATTEVTTVYANDSDACEPNNAVNYQIGLGGNTSATNAFSIGADNGIITIRDSQLDRDVQEKYWVEIIANDMGTNRLSAATMVVITLTDINDKAPSFLNSSITAEVPENASNDTVICITEASDPDENPNLEYTINNVQCTDLEGVTDSSCVNPFAVETNYTSQIGVLKVVGDLDRENVPRYVVTVEVIDLNSDIEGQIQTATGLIEVLVTDINDNNPVFSDHLPFSVNEEERDSFIGQVTCTDEDIGNNSVIVYSVGEGSEYWIKVEPTTGIITTNNSLDRETQGNAINVTVVASDKGEPSLNASLLITVEILDVNDHTPQFVTNASAAVMEVMENTINGTYLFQVNATDEDTGQNAVLRYILREGVNEFCIDEETGEIYTGQVFDAEVSENYQIKVEVRDNSVSPRSSEITLQVGILDEDDNQPYYNKDENEMEIDVVEEYEPGLTFSLPTASDDDVTLVNRVNYYFIAGGSASDFFTINSTTAELSTTQKFDREVNDTYDLVIFASSENSSSLADIEWQNTNQSLFHVKVNVTDVNDNPPTFNQESYETFIAYSTSPSTEALFEVLASDPDLNTQLNYTIVSTNLTRGDGSTIDSKETFGIEQYNNKGNIFLKSVVENDENAYYDLLLEVTDGVEGQFDRSTMKIKVVPDTQTVILICGLSPTEFSDVQDQFIVDLSVLLSADVYVDKVIPYTGSSQGNFYKSEIYLHAVSSDTGELMPKEDIESKLNEVESSTFRTKYTITGVGNAVVTTPPSQEEDFKIAILAVIVILVVTIIVCTASFIVIHRKLKSKLRMAKAIEESHAAVLSAGTNETNVDDMAYANLNPIYEQVDEKPFASFDENENDADDSNDSAVVADVQDSALEPPDLDIGGQSNANLLAALSAATQDFGEDNLASVFDDLNDTSF